LFHDLLRLNCDQLLLGSTFDLEDYRFVTMAKSDEPIVVLGEASESDEEWIRSDEDEEPDSNDASQSSESTLIHSPSRQSSQSAWKRVAPSQPEEDLLSRKLRERNVTLRHELVQMRRNTYNEAAIRLQRMQTQIVRQQKVLNDVSIEGRSSINQLQQSFAVIRSLQRSIDVHFPKFKSVTQ
jgi:hypothetical protein